MVFLLEQWMKDNKPSSRKSVNVPKMVQGHTVANDIRIVRARARYALIVEYVLKTECTLQEAADHFGYSTTTIHRALAAAGLNIKDVGKSC